MPYPVPRPIVEEARRKPIFVRPIVHLDLLWDAAPQVSKRGSPDATLGLLYWTVVKEPPYLASG